MRYGINVAAVVEVDSPEAAEWLAQRAVDLIDQLLSETGQQTLTGGKPVLYSFTSPLAHLFDDPDGVHTMVKLSDAGKGFRA